MDEVERAYRERNSLREVARIFGVSHVMIGNWLKKKAQSLANFKETILPAEPHDVLEADE